MNNLFSHGDILAEMNKKKLKTSMIDVRRKASKNSCDNVESVHDFAEFLETSVGQNALKVHREEGMETTERLFSSSVIDENKKTHVIIKDKDLLSVLGTVKNIEIDNSFPGFPLNIRDVSQLSTILIRYKEKVRMSFTESHNITHLKNIII